MTFPSGWMPYHEAGALLQDLLAAQWDALRQPERAAICRERAKALRDIGGNAICVMRL